MDKQKSNAFMHKLVGDLATALAGALLLVGDRTGLFKAMAGAGPLTAAALAERAEVAERYSEEWLAVMAGAGYVDYDAASGTFRLPDEHALFLANPDSEYYLCGLFQAIPTMGGAVPLLAQAFKSGGGVRFAEFGDELPKALAAMNRASYDTRLVKSWLPALPEVVARLQAGGRAVDVGCGLGVVALALARGFPLAHISGIDLDDHSIALARAQAEAAGLSARVSFQAQAVEQLSHSPGWDLITTFDVVHDLPDPLGALAHLRGALAEGGTYLMVEPKVADELADNLGNPFARMFYGMSCLHCVPQSLALKGPGLGACWGEKRARHLAHQAGFRQFQRLDIRSAGLAFYALQA